MIYSLLLAALCLLPSPDVVTDDVDLVEVKHFYDECGKPVFSQTIFYDWSPDAGRYQVRAWRLLKNPAQRPQRIGGEYEAIWHDDTQYGNAVLRRVQAKAFRETWTQYDVEMAEREFLPKHLRSDLTKPTVRSE